MEHCCCCTLSALFLLLTTLMGASKQVYQLVQPRPTGTWGMLATSIMAPSKRGPAAGSVPSWQPALAALTLMRSHCREPSACLPAAGPLDCFQGELEGVSA